MLCVRISSHFLSGTFLDSIQSLIEGLHVDIDGFGGDIIGDGFS
jgi:hypothetical protein